MNPAPTRVPETTDPPRHARTRRRARICLACIALLAAFVIWDLAANSTFFRGQHHAVRPIAIAHLNHADAANAVPSIAVAWTDPFSPDRRPIALQIPPAPPEINYSLELRETISSNGLSLTLGRWAHVARIRTQCVLPANTPMLRFASLSGVELNISDGQNWTTIYLDFGPFYLFLAAGAILYAVSR